VGERESECVWVGGWLGKRNCVRDTEKYVVCVDGWLEWAD
jgi:hypothetical protein